MRLGIAGYAVCFTLCYWLSGTLVVAIPAFIIGYPLTQCTQAGVDRLRSRFFS